MSHFLATLGPWLGTTDLCTQGTTFGVRWGWACSHGITHPEGTPVGTQAAVGWPSSEPRQGGQGDVSSGYPESDTLFPFNSV